MTPINCLIVDDNEIDKLIIEQYVHESPGLTVIGSYNNPLESIGSLKTKDIHLLFLDIDMPVMSGIDFLKTLKNPPLCVFITAYPDYAVEAFDIHAIDYLLKPVRKDRFDQSIGRVRELLDIRQKALHYDLHFENDMLTIKEGNSINRVSINDIVYLEALTNWTKVVTPGRKFITLSNLKNFLEELPANKFLRVHRSYAVARNKINRLQNGELQLGEFKVPVGKTYRQSVNKILLENTA